jgi:hypothetical protein
MLCTPFGVPTRLDLMLTPASFDDHAARRRRRPLPLPDAAALDPSAAQPWAGGRRRSRPRRRGRRVIGFGLPSRAQRRRCGP